MACAPAVAAFKRKMKAKRSRWRKTKESEDVASTVKGRASVCFDSGLGLTSALERAERRRTSAATACRFFLIVAWILSSPRYLAGVTLAPPLSIGSRGRAEALQANKAQYRQDPTRKRALFNILNGPLTVGTTPYFAYALFDRKCPSGKASLPTTPRLSRFARARRT